MLSEPHSLNLKLCSKQYNKKIVLHLMVAPQLSSGWWHNYSTQTKQAGWANEQSMYSLMSYCAKRRAQKKPHSVMHHDSSCWRPHNTQHNDISMTISKNAAQSLINTWPNGSVVMLTLANRPFVLSAVVCWAGFFRSQLIKSDLQSFF